MTAVKVTYANIFSQARQNVVDLISDTSNVADPVSTSSQFRKWIYSRDPDVKDINFKGYPLIIIHPADCDIDKKGSLDGKSKKVSWSIEVEIVTSDRGYGGKDGLGLVHMDTLSDAILKTFTNVSNRNTLSANSMCFSAPITTSVSNDIVNNELVYRRSIMLPFECRMRVSE
jgi:hypothetical protein